jgi:hypothetical protein
MTEETRILLQESPMTIWGRVGSIRTNVNLRGNKPLMLNVYQAVQDTVRMDFCFYVHIVPTTGIHNQL